MPYTLANFALPSHSGRDPAALLGALRDIRDRTIDDVVAESAIVPDVLTYELPGANGPRLVSDLRLALPGASGVVAVSKQAHDQIAEKLGIPVSYYTRCGEHRPELLVENLRGWLRGSDRVRLVRSLRVARDSFNPAAGEERVLRAFLSNRYRLLDHRTIALTALESAAVHLGGESAETLRWNVSPNRMEILAFSSKFGRDIKTGGTPDPETFAKAQEALRGIVSGTRSQSTIQRFGDGHGGVVFPAVRIRNSETGHGGLVVEALALQAICANGYSLGLNLAQIHVGRELTLETIATEETRTKENELIFSKVRDVVRAAFLEETFDAVVSALHGTTSVPVSDPVAAVAAVAKLAKLDDDEERRILAMYARSGADDSLFDVLNAATSFASSVRADDFETAYEVERVVGNVLGRREVLAGVR